MSILEAALEGAVCRTSAELKLPGAGVGAKDEPRGANEEFDDTFRLLVAVVVLGGCNPSRSKLALPAGYGDCVLLSVFL